MNYGIDFSDAETSVTLFRFTAAYPSIRGSRYSGSRLSEAVSAEQQRATAYERKRGASNQSARSGANKFERRGTIECGCKRNLRAALFRHAIQQAAAHAWCLLWHAHPKPPDRSIVPKSQACRD